MRRMVVRKPSPQPLIKADDPRVEFTFDMVARMATIDHREDFGYLSPPVDRQDTKTETQLDRPQEIAPT